MRKAEPLHVGRELVVKQNRGVLPKVTALAAKRKNGARQQGDDEQSRDRRWPAKGGSLDRTANRANDHEETQPHRECLRHRVLPGM